MGKHKKTNFVLNHLSMIKCLYTRHTISGIWVYKTSAIFPLHVTVNSILLHLLLRSSTIAGRWQFKQELDPCNFVNQIIHHFTHHTIYTEPWWRHRMETFSALLALCAGNSRSPVNSPHKGQWHRALMFSLICSLNKRLSKQPWGWWFESPSHLLRRHCNEMLTRPTDFTSWTTSTSCRLVIWDAITLIMKSL